MCSHNNYLPSYYYICVILSNICPHTTMYVSSYRHMWAFTSLSRAWLCRPHITMCPHITICVLILLYMCPDTIIYASSYYYTLYTQAHVGLHLAHSPDARRRSHDTLDGGGARFTCFTGTKVQFLTKKSSPHQADALCSKIGIMIHGNLRAQGSSQELKANYGTAFLIQVRFADCADPSSSSADLSRHLRTLSPGMKMEDSRTRAFRFEVRVCVCV